MDRAKRTQNAEKNALDLDAERLLETVTHLVKRVHVFKGMCNEKALHFDEDVYKGPKVTKEHIPRLAAKELLQQNWEYKRYMGDKDSWIKRKEAIRDGLIYDGIGEFAPPHVKTLVWESSDTVPPVKPLPEDLEEVFGEANVSTSTKVHDWSEEERRWWEPMVLRARRLIYEVLRGELVR